VKPRRIAGTPIIAAGLFVLSVGWLLSVEGRQGIGRDEAQYFRAAERHWGWFEELGRNLMAGRLGDSLSPRRDRASLGGQPRAPGGDEDTFGDFLATVPPLRVCKGSRLALCPRDPPHHLAAVPAGDHRFPLPGHPDGRTGRDPGVLAGPALAGARPGGGGWRAGAGQPHYFFHAQIAAFDAPDHRDGGGRGVLLLEIAALTPLGDRRGVVFGIALGSSTTPG
jgi:hypothetical protein